MVKKKIRFLNSEKKILLNCLPGYPSLKASAFINVDFEAKYHLNLLHDPVGKLGNVLSLFFTVIFIPTWLLLMIIYLLIYKRYLQKYILLKRRTQIKATILHH